MNKKLQRILILPDCHTPYHHEALEKLVIRQVAAAFEWGHLVVLGDFFDNYVISRFVKDPTRLRGLQHEFDQGFALLDRLARACRGAKRVFIAGNHEHRLPKFLAERAPEVYEIVMAWWQERFAGWTYVPYMRDIQIGAINFTHDVGRAGEGSTLKSFHDYRDNMVMGHNHILAYHVEGDAMAQAHVGASFGWLGDYQQIDYRHQMKAKKGWALGFGVGYRDPKTDYVYLQPVPIVGTSCVVEGRLFHY